MAEVIGVIVTFPGLAISSNPSKCPLEGFSTEMLNDYLIASKLNISIIEADTVGSGCNLHSNGNISCTGIYEKLQKCHSDFSVFPLALDAYDHQLSSIPVSIGPQAGTAPQMFASFNYTGESTASSTLGLPKMDMASIFVVALFLLSLIVIAFIQKKLHPIRVAIKLQERKSFLNDWRKIRDRKVNKKNKRHTKHLSSSAAMKSRVICFLFASLFFLLYWIIVSISRPNQIITKPPDYFQTVEEAVYSFSYKILALKGSTPLAYFKASDHSIVRNLANDENKRFVWFKPLDLNDLAAMFMKHPDKFFHISTMPVIMTVKAMACNIWFTNPDNPSSLHKIPPWFIEQKTYIDGPAVATYSRCIKDKFKSRLNVMFHRIMQANLFNLYSYNSAFRIPVAYENKNYLCVENAPPYSMDHQSDSDDENGHDTTSLLLIFFTLPSIGIIISFLTFLLELIFPPPRGRRTSNRRYHRRID